MTRRYFTGGTSGELLPSGEFVVNVRGVGLVTHLGAVGFPTGETSGVLFPRCSNVGGFAFAGQRNNSVSKAAEYRRGAWVTRDDLPFPTTNWPVIYDRLGQLHCNPAGAAGSQGYRYVTPDNVIVSGDQTYGPFHDLSEWTDLGDGLYVGQASDQLAAVLYDAARDVRLLLETGYRRFIVANRDAETVTISMADASGVILLQTTMSELRALPVFTVAPPPPAPIPVPRPPSPEPVPVPTFDPTADQATSTWTDDQLRAAIDYWLRAANSADDPVYWFTAVRDHPTPPNQPDWFYWVGRIKTGDGVGKGYKGGGGAPGPPTPPAPPVPDARIPQLQAALDALAKRVADLEAKPSGVLSKIALRTDNGHYLCAEGGGGGTVNATRGSAGAWEVFTVEDHS